MRKPAGHLLFAAALMLASPSAAECRIALALAVDVSKSISNTDYALQQEGLIAALADPAVQAAFLRPEDHVALAIYEWGGRDYQEVIVGWAAIRSAGDLTAVATLVATHQRVAQSQTTALGWALDFGAGLIEGAPPCDKQVLDVSGDGRNNDGMSPKDAYARRDFGDLIVNGLAIGQHESFLVQYFQEEMIRGSGAFVEVAPKHADFPEAIRRKLIRELTDEVAAGAMPKSGG